MSFADKLLALHKEGWMWKAWNTSHPPNCEFCIKAIHKKFKTVTGHGSTAEEAMRMVEVEIQIRKEIYNQIQEEKALEEKLKFQ